MNTIVSQSGSLGFDQQGTEFNSPSRTHLWQFIIFEDSENCDAAKSVTAMLLSV